MRRVCAWCQKELSAGEKGPAGAVTHGICPACAAHFTAGRRVIPLREFLDTFDIPVVIVDDDLRIITANARARVLMGKELPEIEGSYGGEAIECAHSRLPGGCGKTVHCRTCTIRNTVTHTHRTSKSLVRVPAYADRRTESGDSKARYLVSTEKAGDFVLLRIDDIA